MLYLYAGKEMENKYRNRIVYDADTYFQWDEVKEFSQLELDAIKAIDDATHLGDGLFQASPRFLFTLHTGAELSMGCRMLLNLIRNTKKDGKDIYDMTNAGPNVIKYLFSMEEFGPGRDDRKLFLGYAAIDSLPSWGIYFNDNAKLFTDYKEFRSEFWEVLCDD